MTMTADLSDKTLNELTQILAMVELIRSGQVARTTAEQLRWKLNKLAADPDVQAALGVTLAPGQELYASLDRIQ
jgi:uncharacterized protein YjgD (DUF1641 family)